jgi:general secretion pathway protein J
MLRATRQGGFTLLEVLLAIMLLAVMMAGAVSGISAAVRAMRSGEAAIEQVDHVRTVQEFLRHQISRTLPFPYAQTQTTREMFAGEAGFMRFVAPMPGYLSHGGAYVQTLQLAPGEGGLQLVFTTTLLNGFSMDKSGADAASTVVLLDHIRDGKFSYRGINKQGVLMAWSDTWEDATYTPLMVGIELDLVNGKQINWPTLSVPLMMDATAMRGLGGTGFTR